MLGQVFTNLLRNKVAVYYTVNFCFVLSKLKENKKKHMKTIDFIEYVYVSTTNCRSVNSKKIKLLAEFTRKGQQVQRSIHYNS